MIMNTTYPVSFDLKDGTHVSVYASEDGGYEFFLTRLNSEKHNFVWKDHKIEESYETRFDEWQLEAIRRFEEIEQNKE
jgi:hypothetical protein